MDWKEAEKAELSSFYGRGASFMLIATRTAELLAARGGTMTAPQMEAFRAQLEQDDTSRVADDWREEILAHIAAQGARVAVLEAENERLRKSTDELQRQRDSSNESLEHMRERLTAAEEGNRELVRRAQQAEGERDAALKLAERRRQERYDALNAKTTEGLSAAEWQLRTGKAERERDELKARCATLSAAGQVLSNVADRTGEPEENAPADDGCDLCGQHGGGHGYMPTQYDEVPQKCPKATTRYPCSATCTHEDASAPGHPERVKADKSVCDHGALLGLAECAACTWDAMDSTERTAWSEGAEAMRAACLNEMLRLIDEEGYGHSPLRAKVKSAIEGAAP